MPRGTVSYRGSYRKCARGDLTPWIPETCYLSSGSTKLARPPSIQKLPPRSCEARGISTAVIKDIHLEGFCIDQDGKDTWRHWKAGASTVVARGLDETDILVKWCMALEEILPAVETADLVI